MYKLNIPEVSSPTPKLALISISLLVVGVVALVILVGVKQPDSSTHTGSIELVQVTQAVAAGQSIVIGINNVTLYAPEGAVALPGLMTITSRAPNLFPDAQEKGWVRSPVVNVEYWNAQGTPYPQVSFTIPVSICFKITKDLWEGYVQAPDQFQVHYYAEGLNPPRWEPLPMTANPDRLELCGQTGHLSIFALALREQTVIPRTGATPTLSIPVPPGKLYEP